VMTPLEFLARLAALVPPPRYPLLRYHVFSHLAPPGGATWSHALQRRGRFPNRQGRSRTDVHRGPSSEAPHGERPDPAVMAIASGRRGVTRVSRPRRRFRSGRSRSTRLRP
jgi:hypothetical protein